jgi:hypothetical protein
MGRNIRPGGDWGAVDAQALLALMHLTVLSNSLLLKTSLDRIVHVATCFAYPS